MVKPPGTPLEGTAALHFHALDLCDGCGAALQKGEQLAGLCRTCNPPARRVVHTAAKSPRRERKEASGGR
jgi:predicted amidophosphoribosyltransferase